MNKQTRARLRALIPGGIPRWVRCYDNGDKIADRYTVVFTGRYRRRTLGQTLYLGMSTYPFHPQGIGMHGESPHPIDRPRYSHLGKPIAFGDLPEDCQRAVRSTYMDLWDLPDTGAL